MASMWKRAMTYLGLGDDEDYVEYDDDEPAPEAARRHRSAARADPVRARARRAPSRARPTSRPTSCCAAAAPSARCRPQSRQVAVRRRRGDLPHRCRHAPAGPTRGRRGAPPADPGDGQAPRRRARGRSTRPRRSPTLIKGSAPVIMNLQEADRDLSRRLIDFASGLCYGVGGSMERVANSVYLLTPADVEVSAEDKRRLEERGYSG